MPENNIDDKIKNLKIESTRKPLSIQRKPSRKKYWWIGLILLAIVIFFVKPLFTPADVDVAKVTKTVPPAMGEILLTVSGYVVPNHPIELAPKIMGRVKWIGVDKGDKVKKGQEIVRIEDTEYQAQVNEERARLASAKAKLAELKAGSRKEEISMALASLHEAQTQFVNSESNYNRSQKLYSEGAVSKETLDNSSTQFAVAKSQLDSAKDNYAMTKTGPREELIQAAQGEVNAAEASLEFAESQLSDTIIRAPIDGTILERLIEVGEIVTNTSFGGTRGARTALLSMADLRDIQVEIDINEADIHKVHQDQPASIMLEAYPDYSYKGKLVEIAPQANRQKATVQVKVQFLNPDDKVRPEMTAKVSFLNDIPPDPNGKKFRIYVPSKAIVTENGDSFVFIVNGNIANRVKIVKGKDDDLGTEVEQGLTGDETIVVGGLDKLKDGSRISIKKS